ncbi:PC-esterase domain-containing protein 1B-like [Argiope bruennichi]|uniref:PC-esterase domain-containing protein 1A n=1 Tax=Argiope bruennichi TaxID=94029 RepID=A0A8T0EKY3_ARGBR|nr:PC-esterase domain-containing protein 1B-like [Argiope bruennichi]KAF8774723.1 PC-esterase domain-containing protein 1A [Argiope bruennichi]
MFDIFLTEDIRKLMRNKSIVFLGDSNVRALYKDFLCLLRNSQFISDHILRTKMENTVFGDKLVYHGEKTNARCYREEREASIESTRISFFFLTKIYDDYIKEVLKKITMKSNPDVIVINSCLWDITRWGFDGVEHFKENLKSLMEEFKVLFSDCLIIWVTAPPIACELKGGFLVKELQFLKYSLRFHVVEANHYARKVVIENGFDVLDTHYHLHMQIHRRCNDGIHWKPKAVRYITNLLLRHISLAWDIALPHRYESISVDENLLACEDTENAAILGAERKENADNLKQMCQGKSTASLESNRSVMKTVNKLDETEGKNSAPPYKVSRKEESIHSHMAKNDKKNRSKRIRMWKQNNPQSTYRSTAADYRNYPVFNTNFQYHSSTSHPSQRFTHLNFPPNPNCVNYPSFSSYHPGPGSVNSMESNFGGQIHYQNYGPPYAFPLVVPGQLLQPNFHFSDEIPWNFRF